ncbi:hypothetical protein [Paractinoplanes rishiriensis]|uniref:Uncharacterized protein n=1 Tax=Paractinoplanes rishiriensis TaxID=1050105 RepID=A0A919MVF5_9ACTN|nr:hypothetical protein [Actinoplanes rishiriensis]GIF01362.1 hypothetical protein Ari01nite_88260 [Actinoplanes rishiriensis]
MTEIRAGAGRARIVLPDELDPHRVRVLVLDDGVEPLTVAAVDRSLPPQCHAGICRVLAHVTHVPEGRVLLCVGPPAAAGGPLVASEAVQHAIEDAVAWAAFAARSTCRPARLGGTTGPIQVDDAEGRPIALLTSVDGAPAPDAVERDGLVALALTAGVTARLADLVDAPH